MQPLDVSMYSPFKRAYSSCVDDWMANNVGKRFSIYNVAETGAKALALHLLKATSKLALELLAFVRLTPTYLLTWILSHLSQQTYPLSHLMKIQKQCL